MLIRVGYKVEFEFQKAATVLCLGSIHPSIATRIRKPESLHVAPAVSVTEFVDGYGNRCSRMVVPAGRSLVQAVCDFVHQHIRFDYLQARAHRTARDVYRERMGVCRDYMHLAITLCRSLNIPARYCTGYLGDIGVPPAASPMDFSAWFEVYLDGAWYPFDARNNIPRIGRILMARGRDAADVALTTTFGRNQLRSFNVWTHPVSETG